MILVYTGEGKGKTSACAGQALRALGQGMGVAFGQFMKRECGAGEQLMLRQLLGERFRPGGLGFLRHEEDRPAHRAAAAELVDWAREQAAEVDMLILDEALYALGAGILTREELAPLIAGARGVERHLVLSGRGLPDWLSGEADLVTEMRERKHPWRKGIPAAPGIEF
ncbi:cob(I)yrinic acid a,c-diamide adenosyltransferase [Desulfovibrio sp.]|uniref:cob(I)yrinic acid a,c-diamide adenosyltransferase n=1 Tax=Desulfovibrio sp. TaxID=885 RepID=UPI0023D2BB9B|nr:cob(I)yrinic acid a,c-diamide adenosyltransferase [Desulfovibrio sp.]MDE7241900.1 cob(I)yrinic acid a,c-diamide adenosyltransferase [Desulfovibrio sp.]